MTDKRKIKQQKTKKSTKSKSKTNQTNDLDEFRRQKNRKGQGHIDYIYKKVGNKYIFIGITHATTTRGMTNIPLEKNPNVNDTRTAYVHPQSDTSKIKDFGPKLKNLKFRTENDKKTIESIKKGKKKERRT